MDIAFLRLQTQQLLATNFSSPEEIVKWLGAVQAQEYLYSLWALGLRLPGGTTEELVKQALADRKIVRTWPMRGTIHYVPAEDAKWMTDLMAKRVNRKFQNQLEKMGGTQTLIDSARPVLIQALQDGSHLTRNELYDILEKIHIPRKLGLFILGYWAQEGLLCFGVHREKQPTFTLLDTWVPHSRTLSDDEALLEITKRYFQSHGPATMHDFAWWSGLTIAETKQGIEMAGSFLIPHEYNDKQYFTAAAPSNPRQASSTPTALLLPCFDEYTVAYKDRTAAVDTTNLVSYGYGVNWNNIVINGRIAGAWKRIVKKDQVIVELRPIRKLSQKEQKMLIKEAERFGRFLQFSPTVHILPVQAP